MNATFASNALYEPVSEGRYEVEAAVNAVVDDVTSVEAALVAEEPLELLIDVLDYRLWRGIGLL